MAIFLKLDGIDGESTVVGLEGYMELHSFTWGTSRTVAGAHTAARGQSEAMVQDVVVTRNWDSATPHLVDALWHKDFSSTATLRMVQTGAGSPVVYGEIQLENCGIGSYAVSASASGQPTESLSLNFTKITIKGFKVGDDHKAIPSTASYDVEAAK